MKMQLRLVLFNIMLLFNIVLLFNIMLLFNVMLLFNIMLLKCAIKRVSLKACHYHMASHKVPV